MAQIDDVIADLKSKPADGLGKIILSTKLSVFGKHPSLVDDLKEFCKLHDIQGKIGAVRGSFFDSIIHIEATGKHMALIQLAEIVKDIKSGDWF
jgi:hypothetical protein